MKIRELLRQEQTSLSFEVFPPKKDTDFANVETATLGIVPVEAQRAIRSSLQARFNRNTTYLLSHI